MRHACSTVLWCDEERAVADQRCFEDDLVRSRSVAALFGELHVQGNRLGPWRICAMRLEDHADAWPRVDPDHELVRTRAGSVSPGMRAARRRERSKPDLGLRERKVLAGPDRKRHAAPPRVLDPELEGSVGLRRRARRDSGGGSIARVLAADVPSRIRAGHGFEQPVPRVVEGFASLGASIVTAAMSWSR